MITATIAVCTHNRGRLLEQCLTSLDNQLAEPGQLEVLVVDNGSTDETPEVIRRWEQQGAGRRSVREPLRGISRARNAALDASDRDVVLFLDDDALAGPRWAATHLEAYEDHEHTGSTGGPVGLDWPNGKPAWITDSVVSWYSALELGDETGPWPNDHGPYGVNMSVNRKAALAVGAYDTRLGRVGSRLLSGEEPDLTRRLRDAGWGIVYAAGAGLVHQVSADRLSRRWLLQRGWSQGITDSRRALLADRYPTRRARAERGGQMLRAAHRTGRHLRTIRHDPDALAHLVVLLVRAATGLDLLRAAVVPGGGDRRG
jgi:glycosyltransferase involved in cell wall biosynthesis